MMAKQPAHPYARARAVRFRAAWTAILIGLLWIAFVVLAIFKVVPNEMFDAIAVAVGTAIAFGGFFMAVNGMTISVLAMEQADEHHVNDGALAAAIDHLALELRRKPDAASTVNLSLFGAAKAAQPVPGVRR